MDRKSILQELAQLGESGDQDLALGRTALLLAAFFQPVNSLERYEHHLHVIAEQTSEAFHVLSAGAGEPGAVLAARVAAINEILYDTYGYEGDSDTYNDLQNISLIRVIERRRGMPVALGILYMHCARAQGWHVEGLSFPAHFLLRMQLEGAVMIIDPFHGGREMQAADMRQLLKSIVGERAELSHNFYVGVSNRDILMRLQNNLKVRLIEGEDYGAAAQVIDGMIALAPQEMRLRLDAGVIQARIDNFQRAQQELELYIEQTPDVEGRLQAQLLLQTIVENMG